MVLDRGELRWYRASASDSKGFHDVVRIVGRGIGKSGREGEER
jgi:hypothetical protein